MVIVGGGFGGLYCVRRLRRVPVDVTLIDRRNHHLFQPLLYQVATGGLSPGNIAAPLRVLVRKQKNTFVLYDEVLDFDLQNKRVIVRDEEPIAYDYLIVAAGMVNDYFGNDQWAEYAPGLKSLEDATNMRRRILRAFEEAEKTDVFAEQTQWLTFAVIGAGPTGLELAGTLAEIASDTLRKDFRRINTRKARILLIDFAERVLQVYPEELSESARRQAESLGVEVMTGARVTNIDADGVTVERDGAEQTIPTKTVLWGAGVRGSDLGQRLADAAEIETDKAGRVPVSPDCSLRGHENVFVIGDLAHLEDADGELLPGVAPTAMQQGQYVASLIHARLRGKTKGPFRYKDKGSMATIGRSKAVAKVGSLKLHGFPAWLAWLFVHVFFLIQFENRVLVMIQWAWNYFTFNRSARLITGDEENETAAADHALQEA